MRILSLDLGTQMGWAFSGPAGIYSGSISFANRRFEGGGMRFLRFAGFLAETKDAWQGLDAIVFEEVSMGQYNTAAQVYGGFLGVLTAWCEKEKVPYTGVPIQTIKKHAASLLNSYTPSKKEKITVPAAIHLGYSPKDDNEADALILLHYFKERGLKI